MEIAKKYINGLKKAYYDNNLKEIWENFESIKHGARKEDIQKIKEEYPLVPNSLVQLLEYVDGTYWRDYYDKTITLYFLGSDVYEYPYFLFSSEQIIESKNAVRNFDDYIERCYDAEWVIMDDKITDKSETAKWLNFSDCMNNGGTSTLFIDFTPSPNGKVGQILRYLHDPDEISVIADSFDEYLQMLIDKEYDFINEEVIDDY